MMNRWERILRFWMAVVPAEVGEMKGEERRRRVKRRKGR